MRNFDDEEDDGAGWRYADVDLKPMMAIICILIPLLMFAFSFYEIKVQPVAAPKVGFQGARGRPGESATEETKTPLNLTVLLTEKGIRVKQTTAIAGPEADLLIEKKTFTDKDGNKELDYDYPALYTKLVQIKKDHPDEVAINIGAESGIPFQHVMKAMDASRSLLVKDRFASYEEYSLAAEALDDQGKPKNLFPQVIFVVAE